MSAFGQPAVEVIPDYVGLGSAGQTNPMLERALEASGCIKTGDEAPKEKPSLIAELVAAPVNTFKIGR